MLILFSHCDLHCIDLFFGAALTRCAAIFYIYYLSVEPYTDFLNALNLKNFFTKLLLNIDITRRKVSYKFEFECIDTINTNKR